MKRKLEEVYNKYNRRELVIPDPLQFLYNYSAKADIEIVGMIASSLAYGRVTQILKTVGTVLDVMGSSPSEYICNNAVKKFKSDFDGFKYRFTTGKDIVNLLSGVKVLLAECGSLQSCFLSSFNRDDSTVIPALTAFVTKLSDSSDCSENYLFPSPEKGSACKRLNLFLRWMVRNDVVDLGVWDAVPVSALVVPLDTHMHKICRAMGMTERKQADMKTALEITEAFRSVDSDDPVKYDFALTRLGIRSELDMTEILGKYDLLRVA